MSSQPRLFIEYAAQGQSARDKELLDSKARAHAARWENRKTLPQRRSFQSTKSGKARAGAKSGLARTASSQSSQSSQHQPSPYSAVTEATNSQEIRLAPEQLLTPYEYWHFNQIVLGRVVSPLQPYPVPLDRNRFRSIEYFPELWSRWAADVIPSRIDRQAATDVAVTKIVQRCLTDELHMIAFVSYVLQRAPAAHVSKVFLLRTAGNALSELRSRIEGGMASLEEVVWPIIFLAHYELFGSKSVGAGRAHLKAVVELGGMEYLDEVTKAYLRRMDRGWWSDYPSIFPRSNLPRPQWGLLVAEISQEEFAGFGFSDHVDVLGSDLTKILTFVVDCVRAGVLCKERVVWGSEDEYLQSQVIHRCQELMDTLRERLPAEPEKEACIYPAMIWLQYTTWVMRDLATKASSSPAAYRNITSHAHPNLLGCIDQSSQAHEMLLWATLVGVATSSDEAVRTEYASRALNLARDLDVIDLRISLERYVWFEACAIIDYALICDALDEAVRQNPLLGSQQWEHMRRGLSYGYGDA